MSVRAAQNTDGARKAFSNREPALQMMEEESRHSGARRQGAVSLWDTPV